MYVKLFATKYIITKGRFTQTEMVTVTKPLKTLSTAKIFTIIQKMNKPQPSVNKPHFFTDFC